jgi:flagellar biogenesis protein FliO
VRRLPSILVLLVATAGAGAAAATEPSPATEVDAEQARQRLTALAERYSASKVEGSTHVRGSAAAAENLEQLPLGPVDAAGQPVAEALGEPTGGWTLSTLAALGLVIGLIFAARWAYTKMGGKVVARSSPVVEVLSRTAVAPKSHVLLVRVGGRVLVVGDGGGNLNTLSTIDEPEEVATVLQTVTAQQPHSVSRSFNAMVCRFQGDLSGQPDVQQEGGDEAEVHVDRTRDALSGLASRLQTLAGGREKPA